MSTDWPEDERPVEVDPDAVDEPDSDPAVRDAETQAETPLELSEDQLRGDDPPSGI